MKPEFVEIFEHREVAPDTYRMGLSGPSGYTHAVPGQFVMLRLPHVREHLLPRPFSIHGVQTKADAPPSVEILYKVVGSLTAAMARLKERQGVEIMGPLGNGFTPVDPSQSVHIVAGGMGVAPLRFLAEWMRRRGHSPDRMRIFLGARCETELIEYQAFVDNGWDVACTTDDGSFGDQCLITQPLEESLATTPPDMIYACGPHAMLVCVADLAETYKVPCQVSVEARMACGLGACLGCAVEGATQEQRYWHVCKDGPVFEADQLKW